MSRIKRFVLNFLKKIFKKAHSLKKQLFLRNKNFSILCNNCIGGCIYHILKKEFLSPTINLYINTEDFIKFLLNYDYYVNSELKQVSSDQPYPIGELRDIRIHFNHSNNFDTAKFDWEKRKNRIIKNNMYVIIREIDFDHAIPNETINTLLSMYKNIVIITFNPERKDLPYYQYIDVNGKDEFQKNWIGIDLWDRKWRWLRFINNKGRHK